MRDCSLTSLDDVLARPHADASRAPALTAWLAALPDERARAVVQRALALDAPLLAISFSSLGSCLYARALAEPSLLALAAEWAKELEGRGAPWVQALRAVPLPVGLVAQRTVQEQALPQWLQLPSGATMEISRTHEPRYPHVAGPGPHPERLLWKWLPEKQAGAAKRASAHGEATFVKRGWGPCSLVRTPGATPIELPCPDEGSAHARFSDDGSILFVYGTYDEYAGGFAKLLDPDTLQVKLSIDTARPVSGISVCDRPDRILLHTYGGLVLWRSGKVHAISIPEADGKLSPDGEYIATGDSDTVQVWSVDEVLASGEGASQRGLPTTFDPTGERLVSFRSLYHGRSGEMIARLDPDFSTYLEGGPASPWFQCTEQFIFNLQTEAQMWSTRSGAPITESSLIGMFFPQSFVLAYDVLGSAVAVLRQGSRKVEMYALSRYEVRDVEFVRPISSSRARTAALSRYEVRDVEFEIKGYAVALDREGTKVAIADESTLEVRALDGSLLRRWSWTNPPSMEAWRGPSGLHFSADGARLACSVGNPGWRVWALSGERGDEHLAADLPLTSLADFAPPALADWKVEGGSSSVFTHLATGTRVAFPAPASWVVNPADSRIAANAQAHVALR